MSNNRQNVSSHWAGFHRLWIIIAIILFLLLLLLWLLGYGPGGSKCVVPPTIVEKIVEVEKLVDNPKLLSKIGALEKENSGISGLQAKIAELNNLPPKVVTAADTLAPQLMLRGLSPVTVPLGKAFSDEGFMALDNVDNSVNVKTTGKVDINKVGKYMLTYTATDTAGNTSNITRTVNVVAPPRDVVAPRLNLIGSAIERLPFGSTFIDTGASSMDNVDGRASIKVDGKVDGSKAGEYIITYTSTDAAGNTSTAKRKVIIEAPLALAKLYFEVNSSEFPADTNLSLASVISYLRNNSSSTAVVSGYHDPSGNAAHNETLSYNRAIAVRDLLQESGVTADRIILMKPAATTGTGTPEEARRVEVQVVK